MAAGACGLPPVPWLWRGSDDRAWQTAWCGRCWPGGQRCHASRSCPILTVCISSACRPTPTPSRWPSVPPAARPAAQHAAASPNVSTLATPARSPICPGRASRSGCGSRCAASSATRPIVCAGSSPSGSRALSAPLRAAPTGWPPGSRMWPSGWGQSRRLPAAGLGNGDRPGHAATARPRLLIRRPADAAGAEHRRLRPAPGAHLRQHPRRSGTPLCRRPVARSDGGAAGHLAPGASRCRC
jgi:hypothetical protein